MQSMRIVSVNNAELGSVVQCDHNVATSSL